MITTDNSLLNKVIVISGGTKGLGRAIVLECVKKGAAVVFGGRDELAADIILEEIARLGGSGIFVYTDLRDVSYCSKLFDRALECFDRVDGFVNYAGLTYAASLEESTEELYDAIFDVNTKAAFFCVKNAVSSMLHSGGGSIILIGTAHAERGQRDRAAYACSKGALKTLMEHVAYHYARDHVRCNMMTIGWTPTEGELALRASQGMSLRQLHETASAVIPMGRMLDVNDYLPGIIYLLSDSSSMVTGSNFRITGGEYI